MKPRYRALVSLVLLALVLWRLDLERTLQVLETMRADWLLISLAAIALGVFWSAWKWRILAAALGVKRPYRSLVKWYFIGSFFNHFLPTTVGGDTVRVTLMATSHGELPAPVCSVLVERLTGIIALICIATVGSFLFPVPAELQFLAPAYLLLLAAAVGGFGWLLSRREFSTYQEKPNGLQGKLRYYAELYAGQIASYRSHPGALVVAFLFSIAFQLLAVSVAFFVARTLMIPVAWETCLLCVPLATLATLFPISINGIGVRETAYVVLFTRSGLSSEQAFLIGFGTFLFVMMVSLVGGTLALWTEKDALPGGTQS